MCSSQAIVGTEKQQQQQQKALEEKYVPTSVLGGKADRKKTVQRKTISAVEDLSVRACIKQHK